MVDEEILKKEIEAERLRIEREKKEEERQEAERRERAAIDAEKEREPEVKKDKTNKFQELFKKDSSAAGFILLGLLIYAADLITRFNGLDLDISDISSISFWNAFFKSAFFIAVILILVLYYLFKDPKPNGREFGAFAALVISFTIVIALGGLNKGLLHFFLVLILYFALSGRVENKVNLNWSFAIILLIDFFGFVAIPQLIVNYLPTINTEILKVLANRLTFPIWFYYSIIETRKLDKSKLTSILIFVIIAFNLFYFVDTTNAIQNADVAQLTSEQVEQAQDFFLISGKKFTERVKEVTYSAVDPLVCALSGELDQKECITKRQIKRKPELAKEVLKGQTDTTKIPTKAAFKIPTNFPTKFKKDLPPVAISIQLEVESPGEIIIKPSCELKKDKTIIPATALPEKLIVKGKKTETIICQLPEDYKYEVGSYSIIFKANMENLEATTTLLRLFIGDVDSNKIELTKYYAPLHAQEPAKVPPDSFAYFTVHVGAEKDPFLDNKEQQALIGSLINKFEKGEIKSIDKLEIDLIEGVSATEICLRDFDIEGDTLVLSSKVIENLNKKDEKGKTTQKYSLTCLLDIDSGELINPGLDYQKRIFSSTLTYSYEITTKKSIEVT